jgi:hypothetical protein
MCVQVYARPYQVSDVRDALFGIGYEWNKLDGSEWYELRDGSMRINVSSFSDKTIFLVQDADNSLWSNGMNSNNLPKFKTLLDKVGGLKILDESGNSVFSVLLDKKQAH